ncbi:MAG: hypothetical protein M1813_008724 [Trichoglossum hirsutum]|jgi:hypothetical protein|nr:MAG: hypothetical protein M1813_008724 [Trichoglossum hirsutum]
MVNWTVKESYTRLLAAIYAAHPSVRFNFNEIARFYGEGATYDAIEGRFRAIKKEATSLREVAASDPDPATNKRKKRASSQSQSVLTGRITKRGSRGKGVKREKGSSDEEEFKSQMYTKKRSDYYDEEEEGEEEEEEGMQVEQDDEDEES